MKTVPNCPVCQRTDQVQKVSTIYLAGIERKQPSDQASLRSAIGWDIPPASLKALSHRLAPPSSNKQAPIRPIHPDLAVLAFSLAAPIFLYGILTSQAVLFFPVLVILAGFYGVYLWQRKKMIARFESRRLAQQKEVDKVKRGIENWMQLFYCARDDGVFESDQDALVPADQMLSYLKNKDLIPRK